VLPKTPKPHEINHIGNPGLSFLAFEKLSPIVLFISSSPYS